MQLKHLKPSLIKTGSVAFEANLRLLGGQVGLMLKAESVSALGPVGFTDA